MHTWIITWPNSPDLIVEQGDHLTLEYRGHIIGEFFLSHTTSWLGAAGAPIHGSVVFSGSRGRFFSSKVVLHHRSIGRETSQYLGITRSQFRHLWVTPMR